MKNKQLIEDLKTAGELLYGERWQTNLSKDLGLSDARRIRQWMAGDRPLPTGIVDDAKKLIEQRVKKMADFLKNS